MCWYQKCSIGVVVWTLVSGFWHNGISATNKVRWACVTVVSHCCVLGPGFVQVGHLYSGCLVACVTLVSHCCVLWPGTVQVAHLYSDCLFLCGLDVSDGRFLQGLRWLSVNDCSRVLAEYAALSNWRSWRMWRSALTASSWFHSPLLSKPRSHAYK